MTYYIITSGPYGEVLTRLTPPGEPVGPITTKWSYDRDDALRFASAEAAYAQLVAHGWAEHGYVIEAVSTARREIERDEFVARFGQEPAHDDLERVNCRFAGERGHAQCGVCCAHRQPRFLCGCMLRLWQPGS